MLIILMVAALARALTLSISARLIIYRIWFTYEYKKSQHSRTINLTMTTL